MLEFEPRVIDLRPKQDGFIFRGSLHFIDGEIWVDNWTDCPGKRSSPEQIHIGRTESGNLVAMFKEDVQIETTVGKSNRSKVKKEGDGKILPLDLSEYKKCFDGYNVEREAERAKGKGQPK